MRWVARCSELLLTSLELTGTHRNPSQHERHEEKKGNSFYRLFGKEKTKLIRELVMRKNLTKTKKGIDDKLRLQLESFFLDDVNKLKEILPLQNVNWLNNGKDS